MGISRRVFKAGLHRGSCLRAFNPWGLYPFQCLKPFTPDRTVPRIRRTVLYVVGLVSVETFNCRVVVKILSD